MKKNENWVLSKIRNLKLGTPYNFKGYYIWNYFYSSSKTLSYSWNGFYVRHFLSVYSTILYLKPLISHVKLSKSFMKIELYYIHISYLSQCVTFKHPSKLVKHKLPCKNHVRNTATLSLPPLLLLTFHNCLCNQYWTYRTIVPWLACLLSSLVHHNSVLIQKNFVDVILYLHMNLFSL